MSRFFVPADCIKGKTAFISGREAHHILDVMRLKKYDSITAFDGRGKLYRGKILEIAKKQVKIHIEQVLENVQGLSLKIALVQAIPKMNKMDYIVEKSTELGVDVIIPTQTQRTVVRLDKKGRINRRKRWQRISQEAAKQCARLTIPEIKDLTPWSKALSSLANFDLKLLASLEEGSKRLKDVLTAQNRVKSVALLIGPEGDFTSDEIGQACDAGCLPISLGANVLKSDTAAITALAMIKYELS